MNGEVALAARLDAAIRMYNNASARSGRLKAKLEQVHKQVKEWRDEAIEGDQPGHDPLVRQSAHCLEVFCDELLDLLDKDEA